MLNTSHAACGQHWLTLQLDTAIILETLRRHIGTSSAEIGLAGCADMVMETSFTHDKADTLSLACCSNYQSQSNAHISKRGKR
jgi:hypothetical protein